MAVPDMCMEATSRIMEAEQNASVLMDAYDPTGSVLAQLGPRLACRVGTSMCNGTAYKERLHPLRDFAWPRWGFRGPYLCDKPFHGEILYIIVCVKSSLPVSS